MRLLPSILIAASLAAPLALSAPAAAQTGRVPGTTWRQRDRTDALRAADSSPQSFAFEMRFGPYKPEVDESDNANGAYKRFFGTAAQLYFGLEFDYLPIRIPYVGAIGPGFGWGFTTTSATAPLANGGDSGETTSLTIMPMHLSAVLRGDELMRRTGVPIVPYVKFGYGLGYWKASDSNGTSTRVDAAGKDLTDDANTGVGTTSGYHLALGASLALNFLDPRAIASLDQTMGVNHVYIFAEWMNARLTGLGSKPQMHVGTSTVIAGLALDM
jgi:hypothetical protein